jgi:hypothetical protein
MCGCVCVFVNVYMCVSFFMTGLYICIYTHYICVHVYMYNYTCVHIYVYMYTYI